MSEELTCAYCGQGYPPGTPRSQHELLTEHIRVCPKHPMRTREKEIADAKKVLIEAMGFEEEQCGGLVELCHVIVSQRDNARTCEEAFGRQLAKAMSCDAEKLKLLRVTYGTDFGLVSLASHPGKLLASTWNTGNFSCPSNIPKVVVEDHQAYELFGEEHSWEDVIKMLSENYDWKNKTLNLPEKNGQIRH